ncbi:acyl-ACP--UDP-N-acetylglucosamine O-acyltransferase [Cyclobacterium marinum]|jgi:UDP-N-acetylglucosamine acyltransferase|uniref:Acyl-(Acyl-carrier-protein)--UDP-N-acetylglucosa mineO-acyltransferase n=1 Tax=Cyclobacterium marinum (strain ATCC 25205 / DSM 745 / LMG 13164 / NCIMB 1802) TaxID=880070 RepID=G0J4N2_CYCMS|nr:acyl-ACP--UDP-N-acetylglucosamine O-acyltransferase [Cyclobacterium marinum]AEL24697.1 acyl-(acyl-carrier-protein)--UDP-N-acetylglucosa mineO-acyltransferase [Cyclobacterium marinum DSM 745]MBI0401825.1 acyl-ACP--UDP-N-acetylglucosamine O-acyltransferase [Cyclobacterium marinum]|tara:strand:+ start:47632 stop:48411 length:780 start_codon:yes stop_codon:yes gene_type:complete
MISKLSEISEKAHLGENVSIEAFSSVHPDVEIGDGTWIGSNVTIYPGARIGKNCRIFPGAVIAAIPQDLKFNGEPSLVEIGDNTTIREFVTINRGTADKQTTKIGDNCLIMAYVHIAHDCIIQNRVIIANSVQVAGHVTIDDWAFVGGSSAIHQFVKIGMHSMISGGSLVRKDVPPFTKAAREPLSYAGVNSLGLRRRGFESHTISEIQEVYRFLFLNNWNNSKALEEIEINLPATKERDEIVNFIRSSERGVMKGYIQ